MQNYTTELTSAGVDWLTVSADGDGQGDELRRYGIELMMADAAKHNTVRHFKRGPYAGGGTRHVGVGEWHGKTLVEVTGRAADVVWPDLLPLADRVSRIDLQVTVRQDPYDKNLALRQWSQSLVRTRAEGKPPQYRLIAGRGEGSTLYIGRGASRYEARLYERWWKEKIDENVDSWRYEVQARRERAQQTADLLSASAVPRAWARDFTWQHFVKRGVAPIYRPEGACEVAPLPEPETDEQKQLRWLSRGVRPVIDRMNARGSTDKWRTALGLPPIGEPDYDDEPPPDADWWAGLDPDDAPMYFDAV